MNDRQADRILLEGILAFVSGHSHPDVQRFKANLANWGGDWCEVEARHLPAADLLPAALAATTDQTHGLVALFQEAASHLRWEQSYSKADGVVGDDMLAGYGFVEIIGKHGPFISTRARAGIGIWGPDIDYPLHRHKAEEVYVLLSGSARFQCGQGPGETKSVGDVVHRAHVVGNDNLGNPLLGERPAHESVELTRREGVEPRTIAEVGCGAGEILRVLQPAGGPILTPWQRTVYTVISRTSMLIALLACLGTIGLALIMRGHLRRAAAVQHTLVQRERAHPVVAEPPPE